MERPGAQVSFAETKIQRHLKCFDFLLSWLRSSRSPANTAATLLCCWLFRRLHPTRLDQAAEMLSPDFRFLWQFNGDMTKADYLAEGKGPYATLRTALPDLFWNSYDYRVRKGTTRDRSLSARGFIREQQFVACVWCLV